MVWAAGENKDHLVLEDQLEIQVCREKQDPEDFQACQVCQDLMVHLVSRVTADIPGIQVQQAWVWRGPQDQVVGQVLPGLLVLESRVHRDAGELQGDQESVECLEDQDLWVHPGTANSVTLWPRRPTLKAPRKDHKLILYGQTSANYVYLHCHLGLAVKTAILLYGFTAMILKNVMLFHSSSLMFITISSSLLIKNCDHSFDLQIVL